MRKTVFSRPRLEALEGRCLPATYYWVGMEDENWFNQQNWFFEDVGNGWGLPGQSDKVVVQIGINERRVQLYGSAAVRELVVVNEPNPGGGTSPENYLLTIHDGVLLVDDTTPTTDVRGQSALLDGRVRMGINGRLEFKGQPESRPVILGNSVQGFTGSSVTLTGAYAETAEGSEFGFVNRVTLRGLDGVGPAKLTVRTAESDLSFPDHDTTLIEVGANATLEFEGRQDDDSYGSLRASHQVTVRLTAATSRLVFNQAQFPTFVEAFVQAEAGTVEMRAGSDAVFSSFDVGAGAWWDLGEWARAGLSGDTVFAVAGNLAVSHSSPGSISYLDGDLRLYPGAHLMFVGAGHGARLEVYNLLLHGGAWLDFRVDPTTFACDHVYCHNDVETLAGPNDPVVASLRLAGEGLAQGRAALPPGLTLQFVLYEGDWVGDEPFHVLADFDWTSTVHEEQTEPRYWGVVV